MKKFTGIGLVSLTLAGCMHQQGAAQYYPQDTMYQPAQQAMPLQPQAQAPLYTRPEINETVGKVNNLMDRVRRVERAMIRLDRRMQLIERNELSRMTSGVMNNDAAPMPQAMPQGGFRPMSYESNKNNLQRLPVVKRPYAVQTPVSGRAGYRPVSYNTQSNFVTSSLGVARKTKTSAHRNTSNAFVGMPSLADSKSNNTGDKSVSIWTIDYEAGKVWPGREQLSSSRDVINALAGKKPVALYARGFNPSSKEFRERVRAISKYLSKVTRVDNVPISSMPAKHMQRNTIEIIVTR